VLVVVQRDFGRARSLRVALIQPAIAVVVLIIRRPRTASSSSSSSSKDSPTAARLDGEALGRGRREFVL
jgi:hypothetical protein